MAFLNGNYYDKVLLGMTEDRFTSTAMNARHELTSYKTGRYNMSFAPDVVIGLHS
jgi:hypothetical protein